MCVWTLDNYVRPPLHTERDADRVRPPRTSNWRCSHATAFRNLCILLAWRLMRTISIDPSSSDTFAWAAAEALMYAVAIQLAALQLSRFTGLSFSENARDYGNPCAFRMRASARWRLRPGFALLLLSSLFVLMSCAVDVGSSRRHFPFVSSLSLAPLLTRSSTQPPR